MGEKRLPFEGSSGCERRDEDRIWIRYLGDERATSEPRLLLGTVKM